MSDSNNSGGGLGICSVLTTIFVVLKLTHLINWSWWWVFAPIWIPILIVIVLAPFVALLDD